MNQHRGETFAQEDLPKELPVHSVIGLLEVEFQDQAPLLTHPKLVADLVEGENPLMQTSSLDECGLAPVNSPMSKRS
jgi:hypothetical protein